MNFIETIRYCYLHQHVSKPTQCRGTDKPSTIDLGKSDHNVLTFKFICYFKDPKPTPKYQYHKADYRSMAVYLEQSNWKDEFLTNETENTCELWNKFKLKMHQLQDEFVPKTSNETPFWKLKGSIPIGKEILETIRQKDRLHRA